MNGTDSITVPSHARVVIIGGGIIGCSVAYHLSELGWKDIVLLERKQLTSGTTWHAAGLIAQLRATQNMTRLAKYSQELYTRLEAETGVATGFKQNGSITVALTDARMEELRRGAAMARAFDVRIEEISASEKTLTVKLDLNNDTIEISKNDFQERKFELIALDEKNNENKVSSTGMIEVPPNGRAVISAQVGGYIKNSQLLIGDQVKKGDLLVSIENIEFLEMQQQYLEALEQLSFLKCVYFHVNL